MDLTTGEGTVQEGQPYEIGLFRPEDAEGVVRLFRTVYGDGYPIATFTDALRLIEENEAKRTISSVARAPGAGIVGHCAVFRNAPYPMVYEGGAGVVLPSYRGATIMTRLVGSCYDACGRFGVEVLFGESVCNHTHMQKIMAVFNNVARALAVDLMPADTYAREKSAAGRVSVVMGFNIFKPRSQTVCFPAVYAHVRDFLYDGMEGQRQFVPGESELPSDTPTRITTQVFEFAQVARLNIEEAGSDFIEVFAREEADLREKGVVVSQVWVKLSWPWAGRVTDALRARGYFIAGILPCWFGDDGLLLQKISTSPNWEGIRIHGDRARALQRLVKTDWEETASRA